LVDRDILDLATVVVEKGVYHYWNVNFKTLSKIYTLVLSKCSSENHDAGKT
jgi:hypothetical protein